ncbi:hypothetical protein [Fundidesulfovibrio terrae]|uniref:hypothetical protein n=1 Tax=Fundidesulfovibrio terrae TaxID=2922866 RepID=UPI001FAF6C2E|nr:hypothetical protein [Fundidesulfovibrio terrae]
MAAVFRELSRCFTAGVFGGLVNSVFIWGAGAAGLSALVGVNIAPAWTPPWLYQRLVWGGVWGFLFMLPVWTGSVFFRGLVFGLAPSAVQLLVVFPEMLGKGMFGLALGGMTPVYVLIANTFWGVGAAWWEIMNHDRMRFSNRL